MGNQASVPEKVYKAAKQNDVLTLKVKPYGLLTEEHSLIRPQYGTFTESPLPQNLIRELYQDQPQGQSIQALGVLEFKDGSSWTPLVVASAKANYAAAELVSTTGRPWHS